MRLALKVIAAAAAAFSASAVTAASDDKPLATIFKNPQCTCCESYGEYLRANGYPVKMIATHDLAQIKQRQGIPAGLEGCHTALVGGYFIDGHVPVETFDRLLAERPKISGISLPGMPTGSPGMGGPKTEPWTIVAVTADGQTSVYARQ